MKIAIVDKSTKIDLTDEKQMKEIFKDSKEVDLGKKGKRSSIRTFTMPFESPDKLFNEGRHPNQAFLEQMYRTTKIIEL